MEEKTTSTANIEQKSTSVQPVSDELETVNPVNTSAPRNRKVVFDADGRMRTSNPSAFWLPEMEVRRVIHGTTYIVTGSYDGTEPFTRKLERIMARDFLVDDENDHETDDETED